MQENQHFVSLRMKCNITFCNFVDKKNTYITFVSKQIIISSLGILILMMINKHKLVLYFLRTFNLSRCKLGHRLLIDNHTYFYS